VTRRWRLGATLRFGTQILRVISAMRPAA
jgi:hypothetical protein